MITLIDMKAGNLEHILGNVGLPQKYKTQIQKEIYYYDEYYLTTSGKIVKAFYQEFIKDPYMDLPPIPKLRLITYQTGVSLSELEQIFEMSSVPIITRASKNITLPGFSPILNRDG